jgi:hypothetical protein
MRLEKHEAAHACIALVLGARPQAAIFHRADGGQDGAVFYPKDESGPVRRLLSEVVGRTTLCKFFARTEPAAIRDLIVLASGEVGERFNVRAAKCRRRDLAQPPAVPAMPDTEREFMAALLAGRSDTEAANHDADSNVRFRFWRPTRCGLTT